MHYGVPHSNPFDFVTGDLAQTNQTNQTNTSNRRGRLGRILRGGLNIGGAIGALGGLGKVGAFMANPVVGMGVGLLGGLIGARRASRRQTSPLSSNLNDLVAQLQEGNLDEFRQVAMDAAPSFQDFSRLAQATGGSTAAAGLMAEQAQNRAGDVALRAFQQQQRANQGLLANIYGQQFSAMQQDRAFRRQTGVDIFSNIANLGAGLLGQRYGSTIQEQQNKNLMDSFSQAVSNYNNMMGG